MRPYIVLRATVGEEVTFTIVAEVEAHTSKDAVRQVAGAMTDTELDGGVTHVAVPSRSWRSGTHTFQAKTQRRLFAT